MRFASHSVLYLWIRIDELWNMFIPRGHFHSLFGMKVVRTWAATRRIVLMSWRAVKFFTWRKKIYKFCEAHIVQERESETWFLNLPAVIKIFMAQCFLFDHISNCAIINRYSRNSHAFWYLLLRSAVNSRRQRGTTKIWLSSPDIIENRLFIIMKSLLQLCSSFQVQNYFCPTKA